MRILAVDMGTGTQDILLFDADRTVENSVKMVLPSATEIAARRIRRAARDRRDLVLTGDVAGGGPCAWALEEFLRGGGRAFATPEAAQTFDDDLERVRQMGVTVVSDDEVAHRDAERVVLRDLDLDAIGAVLAAFEEPATIDGLALGCLDHGAAPPGVSDRLFRFEHLRRTVEARNDLLAFASRGDCLPHYLTRARAMVAAAADGAPVAFMDTGPAAALGALHDERVFGAEEAVVLNLGNMHLLGFHLHGRQVASLFEHHTGEVSAGQVERFTRRLAEGTLAHDEIFESKGHGAYHADRALVRSGLPEAVAVTGPRRAKVRETGLRACYASPFGDMMISGCFGLLRGFAEVFPEAHDAVAHRLGALPG
ncbi:MAG: pyruvate formate lyase-activating protein [Dehalococcoidia bacterium]|nr:pyruvate formate lyase-activating protein [Dehalococcoidia bacterium]